MCTNSEDRSHSSGQLLMTTTAIPLSNDDEAVIHRSDIVSSSRTPDALLEDIYEIARTVKEIETSAYKRVALQFPDELLADANSVTSRLKVRSAADVAFYVLGDTSYGSCCVDEVAAEHVNAEVVVHYGRSCLSPTSRLPIVYIFGKRALDVDMLLEQMQKTINQNTSILVVSDTTYISSQSLVIETLQNGGYKKVVASSLKQINHDPVPEQVTQTHRTLPGRTFTLPDSVLLSDVTMLYIGPPSPTLTTTLMTHTSLVSSIYSYDPLRSTLSAETSQNIALRRRYAVVQKARDAGVIGIVVGTLGVSRYLDLIKHLRSMISQAGKKSYLFAMGKLNPSKMANFSEIDTFVLVACGENSMVDSKEFYKPIVTPYELSLALNTRPHDAVPWTGDWITDFETVLSLPSNQADSAVSDPEQDRDAPHFSLVTGKYSSSSKPMYTSLETGSDTDYALTTRRTETALSKIGGVFSPAAEHLKARQHWAGLGTDQAGEREGENADSVGMTEGRTGVARGYDEYRPV